MRGSIAGSIAIAGAMCGGTSGKSDVPGAVTCGKSDVPGAVTCAKSDVRDAVTRAKGGASCVSSNGPAVSSLVNCAAKEAGAMSAGSVSFARAANSAAPRA
jgi:hypothetical protein